MDEQEYSEEQHGSMAGLAAMMQTMLDAMPLKSRHPLPKVDLPDDVDPDDPASITVRASWARGAYDMLGWVVRELVEGVSPMDAGREVTDLLILLTQAQLKLRSQFNGLMEEVHRRVADYDA